MGRASSLPDAQENSIVPQPTGRRDEDRSSVGESVPAEPKQPRYVHVREQLRRDIGSGMRAGDRLPGDVEIERRFGVSRVTARRAVADLVAEGLVERRRGSGTYVSEQPIRQDLYHPAGWAAALRTTGHHPTTLVVRIARCPARRAVADALELADGDGLFRVSRVIGAAGEPISLITNFVSVAVVPDLDRSGLSEESMTATLRARGWEPARVDETVEARAATTEEAASLAIVAGAPVLVVTGTVSDVSGRPLLWSTVVSRGDRHRYSASYSDPNRGWSSEGG